MEHEGAQTSKLWDASQVEVNMDCIRAGAQGSPPGSTNQGKCWEISRARGRDPALQESTVLCDYLLLFINYH